MFFYLQRPIKYVLLHLQHDENHHSKIHNNTIITIITTMMTNRSVFFLLLLPLWMTSTSLAFMIPPGSSSPTTTTTKTTTTALSVGWTLGGGGGGGETEDDARFVLSRAKQCAYGEIECTVDDAKELLNEMLHMQSGCVTGTLIGHDICEEQDVAADVVSRLRVKANIQHADADADAVVESKTKNSHANVLMSDVPLMVIMFLISLFWIIQSQPTFIMDHLPRIEGSNFDDHAFLLLNKLGNDLGIGL